MPKYKVSVVHITKDYVDVMRDNFSMGRRYYRPTRATMNRFSRLSYDYNLLCRMLWETGYGPVVILAPRRVE